MGAENGAREEERRDGESCWKENAPQSMARGGMGPGKAERGEAGRSGAGEADGRPRIGQRGEGGAERRGERRADGSTWSRAGQKRVEFSPSTSIESTKFAIFDTGSLVSAKNSVFGVVELRLA